MPPLHPYLDVETDRVGDRRQGTDGGQRAVELRCRRGWYHQRVGTGP